MFFFSYLDRLKKQGKETTHALARVVQV